MNKSNSKWTGVVSTQNIIFHWEDWSENLIKEFTAHNVYINNKTWAIGLRINWKNITVIKEQGNEIYKAFGLDQKIVK